MRMLHAINLMTRHDTKNRIVASWQYALARRSQSEAMRGKPSTWKGKSPTKEMRKKMSDARRGRTLSPEHKAKIGTGSQRWWETAPPEKRQLHSEKIAKALVGKSLTIEHRESIRIGKTGTTYDGKNVSKSLLGNKRKLGYRDPPETLQRKREAHLRQGPQSNNKSGWKWVHRIKHIKGRKCWRARVGKHVDLGLFDCQAAAHLTAIIAADMILKGKSYRPRSA